MSAGYDGCAACAYEVGEGTDGKPERLSEYPAPPVFGEEGWKHGQRQMLCLFCANSTGHQSSNPAVVETVNSVAEMLHALLDAIEARS